MKYLLVLLFFTSIPFQSSAQKPGKLPPNINLVGEWQRGAPDVGSGLDKTFLFFKDSTYLLNYSEFDEVKTLLNVAGHYKVNGDSLYLTIEYRTERINCHLEHGSPGFQKEFVIEGGKDTVIRQHDPNPEFCYIYMCANNEYNKFPGYLCITIAGVQYYKISDDPSKFKD